MINKNTLKQYINDFSAVTSMNLLAEFKLDNNQLDNILDMVIKALSENILNTGDQQKNEMIAQYIMKEFILFQAQEDINDQYYMINLANFIDGLKQELLNLEI